MAEPFSSSQLQHNSLLDLTKEVLDLPSVEDLPKVASAKVASVRVASAKVASVKVASARVASHKPVLLSQLLLAKE